MDVWLLEHDDRMYDMGDKYLRGVYATKELAEADLKVKGSRRQFTDPHDTYCCDVTEWPVIGSDSETE